MFQNLKKIIKNNLGIFYSLSLVFIVPIIIAVGTYYSLQRFEKVFNYTLQKEALLAGDVIALMIAQENKKGNSLDLVQEKIESLREEINDLIEVQVFLEEEGSYKIIGSFDVNSIGENINDVKMFLAQGTQEPIASIKAKNGERFWEVSRPIKMNSGKQLIVNTKISLSEVDTIFKKNITNAYIIVITTSLIMILLVSQYVRISRYIFLFHKIKEVDEMKDNFISMASHELKTPLTVINGYVEMLESDQKGLNKEGRDYLSKIKISTDKLKILVEDLLEVSRLEQNRIPFDFEVVNPVPILETIKEQFLESAKSKDINLILNNELKEKIFIKIDKKRFEQVLINLVGNAIKYTSQGKVELNIFKENKLLNISVKDTGIGISAQEQKNLFQKFYRVKNQETKKISGTGLGLWITKELVERMKGKIEIESIKGSGTRFIIKFPIN